MNNSNKSDFEGVWPGSTIDWGSDKDSVFLFVELPFWLMMPEGNFKINYKESIVSVELVHGCQEIQATPSDQTTHLSTVFISKPKEPPPPKWVEDIVDGSRRGFSVRIHRSTLIFETNVFKSVLKSIFSENGLDRSQAYDYLVALSVGHLPIVNCLLGAYRRVSYDPFVFEVTNSSLPIWFYNFDDKFIRVSLWPYINHKVRPVVDGDLGHEPIELATTEDVREYLGLEETPGESILLDAWNYFNEGRFNDSIRGLVTAIEVLLEARYEAALVANGANEDKVKSELNATAQKYLTRLSRYLELTGRTIPGPVLSHVTYINGVCLRDQLLETRKLRHKIVHEGERVSPFAFGAMLKSVETMTWFFDWLDDNERNRRNRFSNYLLKSLFKPRFLFGVDYTSQGLVVRESDFGPGVGEFDQENSGNKEGNGFLFIDDMLWGQHTDSLFGESKNLPLFVKMALSCVVCNDLNIVHVLSGIDSGPLSDYDLPSRLVGVSSERFRFSTNGIKIVVFIIDIDGDIGVSLLTGILIRLLQLRVELNEKRVHGICVVNHQKSMPPIMRENVRELNTDVFDFLISCDLSLVYTNSLWMYLKSAVKFKWKINNILEGLIKCGFVNLDPPGFAYLGVVVRVFPRNSVIGVFLSSEVSVRYNDEIIVASKDGFELINVESIAVEKVIVSEAKNGHVGIKVRFEVNKIIEGSFVFIKEKIIS